MTNTNINTTVFAVFSNNAEVKAGNFTEWNEGRLDGDTQPTLEGIFTTRESAERFANGITEFVNYKSNHICRGTWATICKAEEMDDDADEFDAENFYREFDGKKYDIDDANCDDILPEDPDKEAREWTEKWIDALSVSEKYINEDFVVYATVGVEKKIMRGWEYNRELREEVWAMEPTTDDDFECRVPHAYPVENELRGIINDCGITDTDTESKVIDLANGIRKDITGDEPTLAELYEEFYNEHFTINEARNGESVLWYADENDNQNCEAVYIHSGKKLSKEEVEKELC